jgi:acyl-coenzyme A synthetase/AMP-(fatty) acid ligase
MSQITAAADVPPRLTDYEAERATFRIEVPERFNAVADIVERWAAEAPADMALVSLDGQGDVVAEQAVADLARESRRAARALLALGIQQGDPVFVMLPRVPAWYSAVLGAIRIGAVPMPGTNQLTSRDIAYRFRSADAVAAITDAAGLEKIDALEDPPASLRHRIAWGGGRQGWEDLDALKDAAGDGETPASPTARHDAMFLYFTSGTVSHAKMVLQPSSYGLGHIGTARFWQDLRHGDRHWTVTDTGWAKAAWGCLFGQWRAGHGGTGGAGQAGRRHDPLHPGPRGHHLVLRAAYAVPAAHPGRRGQVPAARPAPLYERGRAAQPRGDQGLARRHRADDP